MKGSPLTKLQHQVQILEPLCACVGFSTGWVRGCVRIRALYFIQRVYLLTTAVIPLTIKYTVVVKWRSPADRVAGLGGLTVQEYKPESENITAYIFGTSQGILLS